MKCTIPEISWHNRDPVLSADLLHTSSNGKYCLATGGTDCHIVIWQLCILENGGISVEMLSDLTRHNKAVNAVRFSPDGQMLASSDDEAALIIWKRHENPSADIFMDDNEKENKEHWIVYKMLRGHIEDIYDLNWSSCSQYLISGSVDNSAVLWNVSKAKKIALFNDHKGFVQGVTWDPQNQFVSTLSSDRFLRIYAINNKKLVHKIYKANLNNKEGSEMSQKNSHLFFDDTLKSFCRRLAFSPDGELLVAPSGIIEEQGGKFVNVVHVFTRASLPKPAVCFPTGDKYTIAVNFCPQFFCLRKPKKNPELESEECSGYVSLFNLPYRMVFAVATQNSVIVFDTEQPIPLCKISDIHFTRLTDVTWSADGRILVVSSTDGYCSLISFTENELGFPYEGPVNLKSTHDFNISPFSEKKKKSSKKLADENTAEDGHSITPIRSKVKSSNLKSENTPKLNSKLTDLKLKFEKMPKTMKEGESDDEIMVIKECKSTEISKKSVSLSNFLKENPKEQTSTNGMEEVSIDKNAAESEKTLPSKKCEKNDTDVSTEAEEAPILEKSDYTKMEENKTDKDISHTSKPQTARPGKRVQLITLSAKPTSKKIKIGSPIKENNSTEEESKEESEKSTTETQSIPNSPSCCKNTPKPAQKTPRRVSLITLSSPRSMKS